VENNIRNRPIIPTMANVDDDERCIALTNKGERCSRVAKEGQFCFQHDSSSETVTAVESESQNFLNVVANRVNLHPEDLSGIEQDIAQNFEDVLDSMKDVSGSLKSLDFNEAFGAFREATNSTAPTPAKYAAVGGTTGSLGGPAGVAAGATAGAWYGVYKVVNDDRALRAMVVEEEPEDADIVSSDHPAIADVDPIQLTIKSGVETSEAQTEWLRSTLFRERNMNKVEQALEKLPAYHNDQGVTQYYIQDQDTEEVLLVLFGVPVDD